MAVKQTKKQKKAAAFRDRKGKAKETESNPVPLPDLDDQDTPLNLESLEAGSSSLSTNITSGPSAASSTVTSPSKKRKHDSEHGNPPSSTEPKESENPAAAPKTPARKRMKPSSEQKADEKADNSNNKQRFILFLGNLRYTTTLETIQQHFASCDPPPKVRLLTPKAASGRTTTKSKGCAFLEFSHRNALQQGLKLHHSDIDGRQVNVELTAGGGGKGEGRLQKLRERNKGLDDQRVRQSLRLGD
jgi:nucleolar protein 6